METCLPHYVRSLALKNIEDKSVTPLSDHSIISNDVSVNNQQFKMELPPTKQNSSRPVPKDSQCSQVDDSNNDEKIDNCLLNGSTNATKPPSSSLKSLCPPSMLPTCTGLQTLDTEEAIMNSVSSTAPITSHDSEIPKLMDVQALLVSSKQPVIENVLKGSSPSQIVGDTGCVPSLNLSSGNEDECTSSTNATTTNENEICIENAAITHINKDMNVPIGDDAVACRASKLESTSSRALAAKTVNSMTTANMSDYSNKQCISNFNDDTTSDLAAITSSNEPSADASGRVNLPTKTTQLQDGPTNVINRITDDNLEKDANEEIKNDVLKNDNHQRDVKSLPTVINSLNFASLTNQCSTDTDAFSIMKNLNDTATNDVAISADADKPCNATATTKSILNPAATVVLKDASSEDDAISSKINDRESEANSPSAISTDAVASNINLDAELLGKNSIKIGEFTDAFEDAGDADCPSKLKITTEASKVMFCTE